MSGDLVINHFNPATGVIDVMDWPSVAINASTAEGPVRATVYMDEDGLLVISIATGLGGIEADGSADGVKLSVDGIPVTVVPS